MSDRHRRFSAVALAAAIVAAGLASLGAQAAKPAPAFDAASVKFCQDDLLPGQRGGAGPGAQSPGRFTMNCQVVKGLLQAAYLIFGNGVTADGMAVLKTPIEGGPDWLTSEAYTIEAVADPSFSLVYMRGPMLQRLLEERFKLKIRRETRQVPVYELRVAKGGPKLTPFVEGSCVEARPNFDNPQLRPAPLKPGQRRCAMGGRMQNGNMVVSAEGITMAGLITPFLTSVDRPVIDRTGLTGKYTIHLESSPPEAIRKFEQDQGRGQEPTAPEIYTALPEQLGLRLEPATGPSDYLVIEHIERPTGN